MICFIRTTEHSLPLPAKATKGAAGYDLRALEPVRLHCGQRATIRTGWAWDALNHPDIYGRVAPRSGLAGRNGLDVMAGTIDHDYQGEIKVLLINHGDRPVDIEAGERIAQFIFSPLLRTEVMEGYGFEQESERGTGGFGSTGKK